MDLIRFCYFQYDEGIVSINRSCLLTAFRTKTLGLMEQVDRIKTRTEQRFPLPGEPVCVVCGRYGEYICNEV